MAYNNLEEYLVPASYFQQGGLWSWGYNGLGAAGDETLVNRSSPVQTVASGSNWKLVGVGGYHNAAIKTDGTLWTWGYNGNGTLGNNTTASTSSPVQTIAAGTNWKYVYSNQMSVFAIKTDGSLWVWGNNGNGQLGTGNLTNYSSPVQLGTEKNWKLISSNSYFSAAIKTDGTLWTWGYNNDGTLGDNTRIDKSSPVQTIAAGTNWKSTSTGIYHVTAIKTDGTLWLWGQNNNGQLGTNNTTNRSSPVQTVAGGTNWKQSSGGQSHTAAIKTDGTLWLWGRNIYGQLGTNNTTNRSSPVQTVAGGTNWKLLACGRNHTAAIKTDGTLWLWGYNNYGQLGDNTVLSKSSPIQTISGGTNWKQVSSVGFNTSAINGTWGTIT